MVGRPGSRGGRGLYVLLGRRRRDGRRPGSRDDGLRLLRGRGQLLEGLLDDGGRGRHDAGGREDGHLALEVGHALGEGLEREVARGPRDARERNLENETLVGGRAHLARGVAENGEDAREAVGRPKGGGLRAQRLEVVPAGRDHVVGARDGGHDVDVAHVRRKLARELQQVAARVHELAHLGEQRRHVAVRHRARDLAQHRPGHLAEEVRRRGEVHAAGPEHRELLQGGQRIAHAAAGVAHHELERRLVVGEALLAAHVREVGLHLVVADGVEVKALHAREDRGEDLLRVRGAHDEDHVLGRLLERLEQGVERLRGEHVDLVDDVDLAAAHRGRVVDAADDLLADVVHAGAGGRVELYHVRVLSGGDEAALLAGAVGQGRRAPLAHERLGQDAGHGGLARSARAAEEVGVARAVLQHGALERLDHVRLANHLLERLRAVLGVERFHAASGRLGLEVPVYPRARTRTARRQVLLAAQAPVARRTPQVLRDSGLWQPRPPGRLGIRGCPGLGRARGAARRAITQDC